MELEEPAWRESRMMRRLQDEQQIEWEGVGRRGRLSEPKGRINLIKINKNKLPVDFFPKRSHSNNRRHPSLRFNIPIDLQQAAQLHKKAESQLMYNSPEKNSFSYFDDEPASAGRIGGRVYNRKFETRDQPKRDAFPVQSTRKLTTATKHGKNEFLELFPSTHDQQTTEIIISSSKVRNFKLSPRKEYISKTRDLQSIIDPEKQLSARRQGEFELKHRQIEFPVKQSNQNQNSVSERETQSLNITFFNAKSSCFPPINRHANNG